MNDWPIGCKVRSRFNSSFTGVIEMITDYGTRIIKTNCWASPYEFGNCARLEQYWLKVA
jgi:hypothetical protein